MLTRVKTDVEIAAMRESGKILASVLQILALKVSGGISTKELADLARQELKALGGQPAFLGYQGFPDVLCTSVNDEVVHGIPRIDKILSNGDIIGLDFGVIYRGMITDAAISVMVGDLSSDDTRRLLKTTEQSLYAGIDEIRSGVRVGDIAHVIETVLNKQKLGIVRDLVGHGVGHEVHEEPNIPNYGPKGSGPSLQAGMTVAIEPMATLGRYEVAIAADGWTVYAVDNSLAAHFEHTVLITDDGAEILTQI